MRLGRAEGAAPSLIRPHAARVTGGLENTNPGEDGAGALEEGPPLPVRGPGEPQARLKSNPRHPERKNLSVLSVRLYLD
ncbi:hypothetical protein [Azospirillum argentinense]